MNLSFDGIHLDEIGGESADGGHQWASLTIRLKDDDIDHTLSVRAKLLVPKNPGVTFHELQEAARQSAVPMLRLAADLLEGASVASLEERGLGVRVATEAAQFRAAMESISNPPTA